MNIREHVKLIYVHNVLEKQLDMNFPIVLYSNTTLQNAIYIYRKYGFVEVEMEENPPYERGDIKMEFVIE